MPIFEYKGLTKDGKNTRGVVDSENIRAARMKLKKDGIYVVELKDKKRKKPLLIKKNLAAERALTYAIFL
jgi:general secretion pathway protein F